MTKPPSPRVSTCGQILLVLQRMPAFGWNKKMPAAAAGLVLACQRKIGARVPMLCLACCRSTSTTTNLMPVGTPIRASGQRDHQHRMRAGSVVAS